MSQPSARGLNDAFATVVKVATVDALSRCTGGGGSAAAAPSCAPPFPLLLLGGGGGAAACGPYIHMRAKPATTSAAVLKTPAWPAHYEGEGSSQQATRESRADTARALCPRTHVAPTHPAPAAWLLPSPFPSSACSTTAPLPLPTCDAAQRVGVLVGHDPLERGVPVRRVVPCEARHRGRGRRKGDRRTHVVGRA